MADPLDAASGYLALGLFEDALSALDELPPDQKTDVAVVRMRMEILAKLGRWDALATVARSAAVMHPRTIEIWLQGAEAIRRSDSVLSAHGFLLEGKSHCGGMAAWLYKLACLEALLGSYFMAGAILRRAYAIAPDLHRQALDDPDLAGFWEIQ